jgi:hypothetical protein
LKIKRIKGESEAESVRNDSASDSFFQHMAKYIRSKESRRGRVVSSLMARAEILEWQAAAWQAGFPGLWTWIAFLVRREVRRLNRQKEE